MTAWSDTDPLMTAMAAAVYEQCETHPEQSLTVDDPRTIAAVAAAVARRMLTAPAVAPTAPPAAEQPADRRARYATAIREESSRVDDIAIAAAVMAVADAEQQQLRAEVEQLRAEARRWRAAAQGYMSRHDRLLAASRLADEAQQPETEAAPPTHMPKGTNAEDCPACKGTNPPYPFLCPGPDAPAPTEEPTR